MHYNTPKRGKYDKLIVPLIFEAQHLEITIEGDEVLTGVSLS